MTLHPGQILLHYRLLEKIGEGGMGEVYRAEDTKLRRSVALKVLPRGWASDPVRLERFQREAEALAALNHPHIVTIYSVEESEGTRFLTMELLEGDSLEQALSPDGLPLPRVFEVGEALADALAAAHEKGVVHRDLKPANVMLTRDGRVKVLDFGLAKLAEQATGTVSKEDPAEAPTRRGLLTGEGVVLGTVPYMSPEQVRGDRIDHRTDIFSLGVVLYEMASGRRPFAGRTSAELVSSILRDAPRPLTELRDELPRHLGRIVAHCLQKEPRERFQSALDVRNELRSLRREVESGAGSVATAPVPRAVIAAGRSRRGRWAGVIGVAFLLALAALFRLGRDESEPAQGSQGAPAARIDSASIAVLPFADRSPEKDQEYFTDGLSEEMLNLLARNRGLRVAARTSSFSFKDKDAKVTDIGRELNVATVLEGSVRKAGDDVRITVQLINVADGFHLWSETYDRKLDDIFALQAEIARSVVAALELTLTPTGAAPRSSRPAGSPPAGVDPAAYTAYLKGQYFLSRGDRAGLRTAVAYFDDAVELEPRHSPAWVGLAKAHEALIGWGHVAVEEGFSAARQAVDRALELDDTSAEAYSVLAQLKSEYEWDWAGADAALRHALELEPGNATIVARAAGMAGQRGRVDEQIALGRRAMQLDPLNVVVHKWHGVAAHSAGLLDESVRALRRAAELQPDSPGVHAFLGRVYLEQGRPEAGLAQMQQEAHAALRLYGLALAYDALGMQERAEGALAELIEAWGDVGAAQIALVYASRGEADRAFEWLDRAFAQRDGGIAGMKVHPGFRNLHGDPRWKPFLEKMGLAD